MNLGINVVEVNGRATPSIQGAATSVAGFLITPQRGAPGVARRITSFAQYLDFFGGFTASSYGAYAVRGFFDNGGGVAWVVRVVGDTAVAASDNSAAASFKVSAAFRGAMDPGTWANGDEITDSRTNTTRKVGLWYKIDLEMDQASQPTGYFRLTVLYNNNVVEIWDKLKIGGTPLESPAKLNDPSTGSKYISVELAQNATAPSALAYTKLMGGTNGSAPSVSQYRTYGFNPLDSCDVTLVACPETDDSALYLEAMAYCQRRGDCMFVGHLPEATVDANTAKGQAQGLRGDKVYGAIYFPWIRVSDPLSGTTRWVPPTGHVLGTYARIERERGVWKAPAGDEARLLGAVEVKASLSDADLTSAVKDGGVNVIRSLPGLGIVIDSSRTLSSNTLWLYVNVRLLFNYVKSSLKYGLRWVVQEPNNQQLWNKVKYNSIIPFLTGLYRRGAFGPGALEDVFSVKIDAENNPDASIQQGILNIEVYFYPSRPAETVIVTVGQQEGGATTSEQ